MKINESQLDRIIRGIAGLVLVVLYLTKTLSGPVGIVLLVVGIVLLVTGILGFCPIYALLKTKTNK